ncbi:subtilisin-like protease SBT1.7 [Malania oleifera]|uniref:subtilisin-like protease SBT1.7 n=1 Tax=Malania oleifera TaxID=397392 RepID=UPI0025ADF721|nr:subtilisin-like protease SBT1.7 [Malania oleifera]
MKNQQQKRTYIIHMDKSHIPASFNDHLLWYETSLKLVSDSAKMLYTYNNVIHGFSTPLTIEEARLLEGRPGVLSVLPEVKYELQTTRTPDFLGIRKGGVDQTSLPNCTATSQIIIGVLDTGVWAESRSFSDEGLGQVGKKWKGQCETGNNFNSSSCNRKLIGARFFSKGYEQQGPIDETKESKSPTDDQGHGTHTATTAAGSFVPKANLYGYAPGIAQGMARCARLAAYKVCWINGCSSSDILAGMDKAVEDGVDVISMSLSGQPEEYYRDNLAIGAFGAMSRGVFVSAAAGNRGPDDGSAMNTAPWITTVGAGTLDRNFPVDVILGDKRNLTGVSICSGMGLSNKFYPLVYAVKVSRSTLFANQCANGTLIHSQVNGKIVVCDRGGDVPRVEKGIAVKNAGGVGMILVNEQPGEDALADAHFVTAAAVDKETGELIMNYINSSTNPTATIACKGTQVGIQPSPILAAFSSRGPNLLTQKILKPDMIAPGVGILAGWTSKIGPSGLQYDDRRVEFSIASGTSMSCPHISGLAALLKAAHPRWSPAAIRSALMTTAYTTYKNGETIKDTATGKSATPFGFGAGHVNFMSAMDPGLIYDAGVDDYLDFLCASRYDSFELQPFNNALNRSFTCDWSKKTYEVGNLNYPSFVVHLFPGFGKGSDNSGVVKYSRTLTNVGCPSTYKVSTSGLTDSVSISVEPGTLSFAQPNQSKNYTVTFNCSAKPYGTTGFARLEWTDGKHVVGSPIAVIWE